MKLISALSIIGLTVALTSAGFVTVEDDGNFYENDKRYIVWGANYWEAMNLGQNIKKLAYLIYINKIVKYINNFIQYIYIYA